MSAVLFIGAAHIMRCFINNNEVVNSGILMIRLQVLTAPFISTIFIFTVVFQATGKSVSALLLSISHQGLIFVPVILILKIIFGYNGVICAQTLTDVLTIILAIFLFYRTFHDLLGKEKNKTAKLMHLNQKIHLR